MKREDSRKTHLYKKMWAPVFVFIITFFLIYSNAFYVWDRMVSDWLCQTGEVPDGRIFIVAIDDKTLEEYGLVSQWDRELSAQVVRKLNGTEGTAPAVICFDIMYLEDGEKAGDAAFAEACAEAGNVITAMNLQFEERPMMDAHGRMTLNPFYVRQADEPYPALKAAASYGFANSIIDRDGYVRRAMAMREYDGEIYYGLAAQVYRSYLLSQGQEVVFPKLDEEKQFGFRYAGGPGTYSVISMCDLLEDRINPAIFQNGIVFIGAYAPGLYDSYVPAVSHGTQMYGVEVQANITDALLHGRTQQEIPLLWYAPAAALLAAVYYALAIRMKTIPSACVMISMAAGTVAAAKVCCSKGILIPVLVLPLVLLLLYIFTMVLGYLEEIKRKRQILGVFRKYVAPQVVEELSKTGDFEVKLGGERRHVAVLFVDIRGFTTMSEKLLPEEVVEILNEYLALTTKAVFQNSGTLDKFVGDAAMAIFNAPFDVDDYIYRAVKCAWDMMAGVDDLSAKFAKRLGQKVSVGIGINCGDAVVGNIGSEFRMDYTAIGDSVNTASRLESNAKSGQILLSEAVYEAVKDRAFVTPIGAIPLKGKENEVFVYQLEGLKDEEAVFDS